VGDLVVTDTSCLIALDRIGRLDLLPALFTVRAPHAVAEEFGRRPGWLHIERVPEEAVRPLLKILDRGEAEAIALVRTYPGARLLVDEERGRTVARRFGVPVTGTAGVLLAAKKEGLIPAVRPMLDALIEKHEFRLSQSLRDEILRAAGES